MADDSPAYPPADDQMAVLRADNAALQVQLAKLTDIAARAQADLLNFKERIKREGDELRKFAIVPLLLRVLSIRDDLVRMIAHDPSAGCVQLLAKIDDVLKNFSVEQITALGFAANPEFHEIVNSGPGAKDIILVVHEEGFLLHGKVLRPAKVMVGEGKPSPDASLEE